MTRLEALLRANADFYEAFAQGDYERLVGLCAREAELACIHPGWPALHGRTAVLESWRRIFAEGPPSLVCVEPRAYVQGEAGFVICSELMQSGALVATNVFVFEAGEWRLTHHHAGPRPPLDFPEPTGPLN